MDVESLYRRYVALTGEAQAAAILVLAESNFAGRPKPPDERLTVKEAADRLRTDIGTVYEMVRDGRLLHQRVGRKGIRIKASDLDNIGPPKPPPSVYVPTHVGQPRRPRGRPRG